MHNVTEDDDDDSVTKPLGRCSVMYYGVGHMLNDITASCWFTYLLLFLTDIGLSPRYILRTCMFLLQSTLSWSTMPMIVHIHWHVHSCLCWIARTKVTQSILFNIKKKKQKNKRKEKDKEGLHTCKHAYVQIIVNELWCLWSFQ